MCGIAGFISFSGKKPAQWLATHIEKMLCTLNHRGPDNNGIYLCPDGYVALGHTRLSIIDLSNSGKQPMININNDAAITFNGEIYNYLELKKKIKEPLKSKTDTEILLNFLYHNQNNYEKILNKINGMFAFAFYNKSNHTLFIARDHFGIKPIYYAINNDGLWFASEPRAILATGNIEPVINKEILALDAITRMDCQTRYTCFSNIEQIEPAEYILIDPSGIRQRNIYWVPKIDDISISHEKIYETLLLAAKIRSVADVSKAAFLSGGVDSSAIVAIYKKLDINLSSVTVGFVGEHKEQDDDIYYAQYMADQLNIKAHNVIVKEENFINVLSNIVYATQKPILHGAEFGMYYAYQAMSKLNHKVVYSGHGSDEFWGYQDGIYFPLMSKEFMVDMHSHYYLSKLLYQSYPAGWYKFIQQYLLPIINVKDKYIENMLWDEVFKYYKDINCLNPYKRARYHMMKRFLVYVNLMVDSISMHFSIEDRPIFQDKALVNLSFMISEYQKNNFGISNFKPYLKLALENILPQKILNRPKIGFQPPKSERYKEILLNYLMSNKSALTNNFKTSALKDFDFTKLLFITSLNIWCEQNKVSF